MPNKTLQLLLGFYRVEHGVEIQSSF